MLNKDVFKQSIQDLIDFYPNWGIKVEDSKVMSKWYVVFKEESDEHFLKMVNKHIKTIAYNPTVSSLLDCKETSNEKIIDGVKYIGGLRVYE